TVFRKISASRGGQRRNACRVLGRSKPEGQRVPAGLDSGDSPLVLPSIVGGPIRAGDDRNAWGLPPGSSREGLCHCFAGRASCSAVHRKREVKGALSTRNGARTCAHVQKYRPGAVICD